MKDKIETPVLLIAFNRPDTTQIVFNSIREVKPTKLFVAIDGSRSHKLEEAALCTQVLEITKKIDWDCEAKYLIRDKNVGCKLGVSGAISWVLEEEDRVIVIEDDIIATTSFFYFAQELLEKYKDDDRVAMISANNYTPIKTIDSDYIFTKYGHIWGWATWKRVWDKFDIELPYLKDDIKNGHLKSIGLSKNELPFYLKYSKKILNSFENNTINAWGPQFVYFRMRNNMLSIAPRVNLASNIGSTSSRTNTIADYKEHFYPADNSFVLLKHPDIVECNFEFDNYHFKRHINRKSFIEKALYRALRILKLK